MQLGTTTLPEFNMIGDLLESLKQASGACSQMVHDHSDPRWMMLREMIEAASHACASTAAIPTRAPSKGLI